MKSVGRNDPCPCGSGKKFKKCCLGMSGVPSGVWTSGERDSALERLMRFAARADFGGDRAAAEQIFWGRRLERMAQDEMREALGLEQSRLGFEEWFVFDCSLRGGGTIVERLLERQGASLRPGEQRYLERMRHSHLRPYEVLAVRPDEGLDLLDLWAGKRIRVRERLATRQLVQWDVLAGRVILGPDGTPILDGSPYLYPPSAKDVTMRVLRRLHRSVPRRLPRRDETTFFKSIGMVFHDLWIELVVFPPAPRIVTAEGDDVVLARVVFDVKDPGAVEAALAGRPDLARQDDGSYVWLEAVDAVRRSPSRRTANTIQITSTRLEPGEAGRRSLGTVVPGRDRLVFEATSRPRAQRGRAMIEALAGGAVAYRATSYEDVEQKLKRRPADAPRDSEIPPEVAAELTGQFYEEHYRKWVDESVPALGGRTPREAACLTSMRPKLVALLKAMEHASARDKRAGRPAYDFGWMWEELGLDRPG